MKIRKREIENVAVNTAIALSRISDKGYCDTTVNGNTYRCYSDGSYYLKIK